MFTGSTFRRRCQHRDNVETATQTRHQLQRSLTVDAAWNCGAGQGTVIKEYVASVNMRGNH